MDAREIPLEDLRWLRALAEQLVHDPHLADDAVQETVVTALGRSPRDARSLRGWLRAILRNVLRQEWRRRRRRDRLAAEVEAPRAAPSAAELVEEVALHRRLIEEVHALDEPYHTAIVLRFLRERTPREIALDLGLTTKAVHTRIERALAKLRERLRTDRRAWLLFLGAWGRKRGPGAALVPALKAAALLLAALVTARVLAGGARTPVALASDAGGGGRAADAAGSEAPELWTERRAALPATTSARPE